MKKTTLLTTLFAVGMVASSQAATIIDDYFSTSLGNWSTFGSSGAGWNSASEGYAYVQRGYNTGETFGIINTVALDLTGYTDVTFDFNGNNTAGAGAQFAVQYSSDGGANWTTVGSKIPYSQDNYSETLLGTTPLTSNAFFRVTKDVSSNNGGGEIQMFDIVISGTAAVPEASTAILGCLGSLLLLRRRRN